MTPIKRKLLYIFRGTLLRLRVTWNHGESVTFSIGYHVDREDKQGKPKWDGQRCRPNTTHGEDKVTASTINKVLEKLENEIDEAFLKFEKLDAMPSKNQLKYEITGEKKISKKGFFDIFDEFMTEGQTIDQWSVSTQRKMKTMKKLLLIFDPRLDFKDISTGLINRFMAFQTHNSVGGKSKKEEEDGKVLVKYKGRYQNDTINRNIKNLKWFMQWAYQKGYHNNTAFREHKTKYKTPKHQVVFLSWDELMRVLRLDLSGRPELDCTRDMFCFCCFTSLRYSDLVNLYWDDVGKDSIRVTTIKTTDTIIIDLNDYSREILKKYSGREHLPGEKVFPAMSLQKINKRLKEIGRLCGIDSPVHIVQMYGSQRKDISVPKYELLSTHCGRRTFICNALSMGVPPNIVMKWTGHSDYKAMEPYIEIADEVRKQSMTVFNRKE